MGNVIRHFMGKYQPRIRCYSKCTQVDRDGANRGRQGSPDPCGLFIVIEDDNLEDLISQMPDIVLVNIISLLELKEAGRTSVLSRRWRDLWKITTVLNFDDYEAKKYPREAKSLRSKYINWVDHVIELHQWPFLDHFRVNFKSLDLSNVFSSSIDKWVKFSIQKGAKKIEINLPRKGEYYTLSQECYAYFTSPSNLSRVTRLMSLSLTYVNINGKLIQYLLQKSPLLEYVHIRGSNHLIDLQIVGPSLKLKHLEIHECKLMESLELFAPKLETFKLSGLRLRLLRVGNLPLLFDLYFMSFYVSLSYAFEAFSSNFSHLKILQLTMSWESNEELPLLHELTKLKTLSLDIYFHNHCPRKSILRLSKLIESAPSLHEFILKMYRLGDDESIDDEMFSTFKSCSHLSLKHVELIGFKATEDEILFEEYLLKSAINIETLIIHTCDRQAATIARRCAYELKPMLK